MLAVGALVFVVRCVVVVVWCSSLLTFVECCFLFSVVQCVVCFEWFAFGVDCWLLVVGSWLLFVGCWRLSCVVCCALRIASCLFVVCCLLLDGYSVLSIARVLPIVGYGFVVVVYCWLCLVMRDSRVFMSYLSFAGASSVFVTCVVNRVCCWRVVDRVSLRFMFFFSWCMVLVGC